MEGTGNDAALSCGYCISTNGGFSWSRGLLPRLTTLNGGNFRIGADVCAAIDLHGTLFISSLIGNLTKTVEAADQMVISRSGDGATFFPPTVVFRSATVSDGPDKDWIAINTFPNSPHANRIAAVFAWLGRNDQTMLTYSDDAGATWSTPKAITPKATGAQPFFLPDGSPVVLYWHFLRDYYDNNFSQIEMVVSPDGGRHLSGRMLFRSLPASGLTIPSPKMALSSLPFAPIARLA